MDFTIGLIVVAINVPAGLVLYALGFASRKTPTSWWLAASAMASCMLLMLGQSGLTHGGDMAPLGAMVWFVAEPILAIPAALLGWAMGRLFGQMLGVNAIAVIFAGLTIVPAANILLEARDCARTLHCADAPEWQPYESPRGK